jgi:hypothetical protein
LLRKNLREFLDRLGYSEAIPDEMLDQVIDQLLLFLEEGFVRNALTLKTGCVLHQITLENQEEVTEALREGLRQGKLRSPSLKLRKQCLCLHMEEDGTCAISKGPCVGNIPSCEVVQASIEDLDLSEWK